MTKRRTTTTTMMTDRLRAVVVVNTNLVDQPATTARWMPLTARALRAAGSEWAFEEKKRRDRKSQGRNR